MDPVHTTKASSQALHDREYQSRQEDGLMGWDADFDTHDLDLLLASRYAPQPGLLLDLGCGGGETSIYFAERGFDVTAIEFSQTALSMARNNAATAGTTIQFIHADMSVPLPFDDARFDVVTDHRAFHCLVNPQKRAGTLREIHRVLRDGGFFFSSTIAGLPHDPTLRRTVDPDRRINPSATRYFGDAKDILTEVRAAGFDILAYQLLSAPFVVDNLILYARSSTRDGE